GLGRLFQAVDDLLDVTGDAATLGKTPGKDARARKATLVATLGIDGARDEVERLRAELEAELDDLAVDDGGRLAALVEFVAARSS
ncbi:MAG TPA: polyprenyl synthetase family protein, partial [Planctomycetota bacterium]|nr:polyprenyl synthetase family protein [Planctomycetota bacterium]